MGYGSPGGASKFLDLLDTPETYTGQALKLAKVNAGETALSLDLLLSFTDWYAGGVPADFQWVFEANNPQDTNYFHFSPIIKNAIGQYIVYVTFYTDTPFLYRYNLATKQWHRLADPPTAALNFPISMSPDKSKLAAHAGYNILYIYDIESNTWAAPSPTAPQINTTDVNIKSTVWADNDTVWCAVKTTVVKCFRYVVSTTTWTQFTNSLTPAMSTCMALGITPDGTALYIAQCGANDDNASKYVISTDTYSEPIDIGGYKFTYCSDRNKLWYGLSVGGLAQITNYIDLSDESVHAGIFPENPARTKPTNIAAGVFETSVAIVFHRAAEPKNMSYSGSGYWKLAEKVLTDYNLVVFTKPADGYAILAIDKVNGFTVPIYLFSNLALPAGTWEFFYPKDGDYTKLKISGSELK